MPLMYLRCDLQIMGIFGFGKPDVSGLVAHRDVDGLIGALNYRRDPEVRKHAAAALAAVVATGEVDSSAVMGPLANTFMRDSNNEVRYFAGLALITIKEFDACA